MDTNGEEVFQFELALGESVEWESFATHPHRIHDKSNGEILDIVLPNAGYPLIDIE